MSRIRRILCRFTCVFPIRSIQLCRSDIRDRIGPQLRASRRGSSGDVATGVECKRHFVHKSTTSCFLILTIQYESRKGILCRGANPGSWCCWRFRGFSQRAVEGNCHEPSSKPAHAANANRQQRRRRQQTDYYLDASRLLQAPKMSLRPQAPTAVYAGDQYSSWLRQ